MPERKKALTKKEQLTPITPLLCEQCNRPIRHRFLQYPNLCDICGLYNYKADVEYEKTLRRRKLKRELKRKTLTL